jgi:ATP-dependent RNA helicase RhlE
VAAFLQKHGIESERIHGNRSQSARTSALAGFKGGKYRVLVATDIAARGIDVESLGHVVNFDVPKAPEDYVHRVGRTARAEATGDAFTFVAPEEEEELRRIEKVIGKRLPRVTVPDFDYTARPAGKLEIPISVRLAEMRAARGRAASKASTRGEGQRRPGRPQGPDGQRSPQGQRPQGPRAGQDQHSGPGSRSGQGPQSGHGARSGQSPQPGQGPRSGHSQRPGQGYGAPRPSRPGGRGPGGSRKGGR